MAVVVVELHRRDVIDVDNGIGFDHLDNPMGTIAVVPVGGDQIRVAVIYHRIVGGRDVANGRIQH